MTINMNLMNVEIEKKLLPSPSPSPPPLMLSDTSRDISGIFTSLNVSCARSLILDNIFDFVSNSIPDFCILEVDDNPLFTLSLFVGAPRFVNLKLGSDICVYILCVYILCVYNTHSIHYSFFIFLFYFILFVWVILSCRSRSSIISSVSIRTILLFPYNSIHRIQRLQPLNRAV